VGGLLQEGFQAGIETAPGEAKGKGVQHPTLMQASTARGRAELDFILLVGAGRNLAEARSATLAKCHLNGPSAKPAVAPRPCSLPLKFGTGGGSSDGCDCLRLARWPGERGEIPVGAAVLDGSQPLPWAGEHSTKRQTRQDPLGHSRIWWPSRQAACCAATGGFQRLQTCWLTLDLCPMVRRRP